LSFPNAGQMKRIGPALRADRGPEDFDEVDRKGIEQLFGVS
jgi:hypothetical protein